MGLQAGDHAPTAWPWYRAYFTLVKQTMHHAEPGIRATATSVDKVLKGMKVLKTMVRHQRGLKTVVVGAGVKVTEPSRHLLGHDFSHHSINLVFMGLPQLINGHQLSSHINYIQQMPSDATQLCPVVHACSMLHTDLFWHITTLFEMVDCHNHNELIYLATSALVHNPIRNGWSSPATQPCSHTKLNADSMLTPWQKFSVKHWTSPLTK